MASTNLPSTYKDIDKLSPLPKAKLDSMALAAVEAKQTAYCKQSKRNLEQTPLPDSFHSPRRPVFTLHATPSSLPPCSSRLLRISLFPPRIPLSLSLQLHPIPCHPLHSHSHSRSYITQHIPNLPFQSGGYFKTISHLSISHLPPATIIITNNISSSPGPKSYSFFCLRYLSTNIFPHPPLHMGRGGEGGNFRSLLQIQSRLRPAHGLRNRDRRCERRERVLSRRHLR